MSTWDDKPNDYEHALSWLKTERRKIARLRMINAELVAALIEFDRLSLIIESAVRGDCVTWTDEVVSAIKKARAAIAKAKGQE